MITRRHSIQFLILGGMALVSVWLFRGGVVKDGKQRANPTIHQLSSPQKASLIPASRPLLERKVFQSMIGMRPRLSESQTGKLIEKYKAANDSSMLAVLYAMTGSPSVKEKIMESPVDPNTGLIMAICEEDKMEKSVWLKEIEDAYPNNAGVTLLKAQLLFSEGNVTEAERLIGRVSELDFNDIASIMLKEAEIWREAGEPGREAKLLAREGRLSSMILDTFEDVILRRPEAAGDEQTAAGTDNLKKWKIGLQSSMEYDKSLVLTRRFGELKVLNAALGEGSGNGSQIKLKELNGIELDVREILSGSDSRLADEYYEYLDENGLAKAVLWLSGKRVGSQ